MSAGDPPPVPQVDETERFASVAIPAPVRRQFTYSIPSSIADRVERGVRVRVPFGRRELVGTVVEWPGPDPARDVEVRPISGIDEYSPRLPDDVLELTRFMAGYYLCSWGEAIECALPPARGRGPVRRQVRRLPHATPDALPARATARRRLLGDLPADGGWALASGLTEAQRRLLPALEREGLIERVERHEPPSTARYADRARAMTAPARPPMPTKGQVAALEQLEPLIESGEFACALLHGATGSGKTEVYFRAAQAALDRGRGVIYLVPEIGLTPILRARVAERFAGQAVVMHSALPRSERIAAWEALRDGRSRFVVGTRSALFAPVENLGLIIVDEEQDGSYKQAEKPRYNARDLAVVRAKSASAVTLLGSATPSMESFHHARNGRYTLVSLGGRVDDRPLPEVLLVDMRREYELRGGVTPVSETLKLALAECLERGDQALVLRNRRGWAPALLCPKCGERVGCGECSVTLTWHRREARLRCHYCAFETSWPEHCPTCAHDELKLLGEGTEQVEDLLRREFPDARIERMDRDALRRRGAHEELLLRFDRGEVDVLVGTQMIAKGHDFHRVTLVGVISADHSLGLPDFRAGERTFQLLTQVAGRAGRGKRPGRVVAQVFDPGHPLIEQAVAQDFESFYEREVSYRRALRYPPFTAVVRIVLLDRQESRAREWGEALASALRAEGGGRLLISGPAPAPIERIKGQYRLQILARSAGRRRLVEAVDRALAAVEGRVPLRALQVDVDPLSVL